MIERHYPTRELAELLQVHPETIHERQLGASSAPYALVRSVATPRALSLNG